MNMYLCAGGEGAIKVHGHCTLSTPHLGRQKAQSSSCSESELETKPGRPHGKHRYMYTCTPVCKFMYIGVSVYRWWDGGIEVHAHYILSTPYLRQQKTQSSSCSESELRRSCGMLRCAYALVHVRVCMQF